MTKLELVEKDGMFEAVINMKNEIAMLQVEGNTSINLLISVDGEDWGLSYF